MAKALENGGFSATQATAAVEALAGAASSADLVTKSDLQVATDRLENKIGRVEQLIQLSEQKIVIRLGGMLVVAVGVMIGAMRYLGH